MVTGRGRRGWASLIAVGLLAAVPGCQDDGADAPVGRSQPVVVAGAWNDSNDPSAAERRNFMAVLDRFTQESGIPVRYTAPASRESFAAKLIADIDGGGEGRPDIALLPQPGLLRQLACRGSVLPLPAGVQRRVQANYSDDWRRLGRVDPAATGGGTLYGVVFKAANKSTVWYRAGDFPAASRVSTWGDFVAATTAVARAGGPAVAVGGANQWVLTDWFENVYLSSAGPTRYDELASGKLPWTDPSVRAALSELVRMWSTPGLVAENWHSTTLEGSAEQVFKASAAPIVFEGDFLVNHIGKLVRPGQLGVIAKFLDFPPVRPELRSNVVVGGDIAVMTRATRGAELLMEYLAEPQSAQIWVERGGLISPNEGITLDAYRDPVSRQSAEVLRAKKPYFDLSDQLPVEFGSTAGEGLQGLLHTLLKKPTADMVERTMRQLEYQASNAHGREPACRPR